MTRIKLAAKLIYLLLVTLYLFAPLTRAQGKEVLVADVDGPVTPVMLTFIERSIGVSETDREIVALDRGVVFIHPEMEMGLARVARVAT